MIRAGRSVGPVATMVVLLRVTMNTWRVMRSSAQPAPYETTTGVNMKTNNILACALLVSSLTAGLANSTERPAFHHLRYEESIAAYQAVEKTAPLDEIKYLPIGDHSVASFGGQVRGRWEVWNNFNFAPENDDDFGLLRIRLHGDLHVGDHVRVFIEGKSATATDRDLPGGRRTLDVDELDLQNAFADWKAGVGAWDTTLRLGRQELSYGAQRLVSPLDWSNTRRTWDGARVILQNEAWRVDTFATRPVEIEKYELNEADNDQEFYGIYAVHAIPEIKLSVDVYLLRLDRDTVPDGGEERSTAGLRLNGTCPLTGVEYDAEGGWQFGDSGTRDIKAWFAAIEAGYTLRDVTGQPRAYLGYDIASGDDDPTDGDNGTFNQLFPLGHAFLGYIDVLGRQNVIDFSQGVSCWPVEKILQVRADHHLFHRTERADAVYNVGGGVLREADAGTSSEIGSEIDLTITYKLDRNTQLAGGYSHFFAGKFIEQSGPSDDIDFLFASVQVTF